MNQSMRFGLLALVMASNVYAVEPMASHELLATIEPVRLAQQTVDAAPDTSGVGGEPVPLKALVNERSTGSPLESTDKPTASPKEPAGPAIELIKEAVDPSLIELTNDQMLALMQESMRNGQLAEQLQGEPKKMLLERNDYIARQLLLATQAAKGAELSRRWDLRLRALKEPEVIATYDRSMDWSHVGALEKWIGQSLFGKRYPAKVALELRRHFTQALVVDRQTNQAVPIDAQMQVQASRNEQPVPVLTQDDGQSALLAWSEQVGINHIEVNISSKEFTKLKLQAQEMVTVPSLDQLAGQAYSQARWTLSEKTSVWAAIGLFVLTMLGALYWMGALMRDGFRYRAMQKKDRKLEKMIKAQPE